ncbi:glyoxalase [Nakamurella antarctica]|uniref:Glyoxalase n=1 Tax=Nakamurella antarctica TaxID=1902245 RepID=A0A3G8ZV92_9ACTN|nr:VOC family protein [Nakamurella antarctica]AZI57611.1 glyoxalase [Nakamurella antarctica]
MSKPTFTSSLHYRDPQTAVRWLERVFGFETVMSIEGPPDAPEMCHYEMAIDGDGRVMIGAEWAEFTKSPGAVGGANTQRVHVQLTHSVDEHYEHAKAAGAVIVQHPEDQFYGDRAYRVIDLEGHHWTFAQTTREVSREQAERALGLPIIATQWP